MVICKGHLELNFLLLAPENTLTHTACSRDRTCDHQAEEVGHRKGRAQVDGDRNDDQVVTSVVRLRKQQAPKGCLGQAFLLLQHSAGMLVRAGEIQARHARYNLPRAS